MEPNTKKRGKHVRSVYWPRCAVCQFMRKNPPFRYRVMQSKYFQPSGSESLADVIHAFGDPFPVGSVYVHMARHQETDVIQAKKRFDAVEKGKQGLAVAAVEVDVIASSAHEKGLDAFIKQGTEKLERNEMAISATNYLAAIKIRSEIDKTTKDRRLDMIKSFFAGGEKKDA